MAKTINPHQQHLSLTHGTPGSVYVLHLEPAYKHARHYIGWTSHDDVTDRIAVHLQGHGSPLIRAAINAGVDVQLATTYSGTRELRRRLKRRHNTSRLCTICRSESVADIDGPGGPALPCHCTTRTAAPAAAVADWSGGHSRSAAHASAHS